MSVHSLDDHFSTAQAHEGDIWSHISNTYFAPFRACTHDVSLLALDVPTCLITASPAKGMPSFFFTIGNFKLNQILLN